MVVSLFGKICSRGYVILLFMLWTVSVKRDDATFLLFMMFAISQCQIMNYAFRILKNSFLILSLAFN